VSFYAVSLSLDFWATKTVNSKDEGQFKKTLAEEEQVHETKLEKK
jgi:hypothetical protein